MELKTYTVKETQGPLNPIVMKGHVPMSLIMFMNDLNLFGQKIKTIKHNDALPTSMRLLMSYLENVQILNSAIKYDLTNDEDEKKELTVVHNEDGTVLTAIVSNADGSIESDSTIFTDPITGAITGLQQEDVRFTMQPRGAMTDCLFEGDIYDRMYSVGRLSYGGYITSYMHPDEKKIIRATMTHTWHKNVLTIELDGLVNCVVEVESFDNV